MAGSVADAGGRQPEQELPPQGRRRADEDRGEQARCQLHRPRRGRVTFGAFATAWLAAQTFDVSTRKRWRAASAFHLLPAFSNVEIRHIRPSTVQAWLRDRQERAAPRSVRVLLANLSGILGAAVEDGLIARNPCASKAVRAPAVEQDRIVPWTLNRVIGVVAAHPARWRALPLVAAGCGLRQGEVFGLRVEDVEFLRHRVQVRQQVEPLGGRPMIAPPEGRKTREVPLPEMVAAALAEHLRATPAIDGLVFTSRERRLVNQNYFNHHRWKPALRAPGVEPTRANGMHALRHFYVSVQLEAGTSVRASSARGALGRWRGRSRVTDPDHPTTATGS